MSLAFAPSATALPLVDVPAWNDRVVRRSRTELSPFLMRPEIIGVLRRWDDVPPISEADLHEFPEDSVEAVAFIASRLGDTQDEVLNATGIKERTYFGWRSSGHRPRASSQGQLWPMVQVVGRLSNVHSHLQAWFQSSQAARDAFTAGDTNSLIMAEMDWALRNLTIDKPFVPADGDVTIGPLSGWSPLESEDLEETEIGHSVATDYGIK